MGSWNIENLAEKVAMERGTTLLKKDRSKKYMAEEFPQRIEIELASSCNLRCTYCPRRYIETMNGFMDFSLFKRLIDEIAEYPQMILVLHRRGESLLHPQFVEACKYVKDKFKEIQLATNSTLLDDANSQAIIDAIDFISFSIDIPEVFDMTRIPAKYDEVEPRILRFIDLNKGKVQTQASMVKTANTPSENLKKFRKYWQGKVDRIRIYEEHSQNGKFGSLMINRGRRKPCVMPFYEMLIYYDGKIGRCNHDWNGNPLGDVTRSTIKEIWHSVEHEDLRRQHRTLDIRDEVCQDCDSWYPEICKPGTGETIDIKK